MVCVWLCVMAPNKIFCASGPSKPPLSICVVCGDYLCPPPLSVKGFAHKRSGSFAAGATSPLTSSYDERSMKLAFSSAGIFRRLFRHVAWKSSNAVTVNRPIDRSLCLWNSWLFGYSYLFDDHQSVRSRNRQCIVLLAICLVLNILCDVIYGDIIN